MCAALVARGANTPVRSRSTEILCTGSLSIVVEGVDGEPPTADEVTEEACEEDMDGSAGLDLSDEGNGSSLNSPRNSRRGSRRGSRASTKEETETKIAFFKTEAAARLSELERLLDEHDQIIRELKRSESTGGLHVVGTSEGGSGFSSAPIPATPVEGSFPKTLPSIVVSKTAPNSPALLKTHSTPE
ncbi:UNVERIFIED_CONTAM: hypothetical protein RMT77_002033 [Armadillidium vulgare]